MEDPPHITAGRAAMAAAVAAIVLASCSRGPAPTAGGDQARTTFSVAGTASPEPALDAGAYAGAVAVAVADAAGDAAGDAGAGGIPVENGEKGVPPPPASAEAGARLLLDAIKADDPSIAAPFFFPGPAFDLVKNIPVPSKYHARLWAWFEEDVHAEHGRYFGVNAFEFEALEMGKCAWTPPYAEGNKVPYWSCRRSRLLARSGEKTFDFGIRVIINWGARWHVIHLGPIRS